jgi:hypothetical protein
MRRGRYHATLPYAPPPPAPCTTWSDHTALRMTRACVRAERTRALVSADRSIDRARSRE